MLFKLQTAAELVTCHDYDNNMNKHMKKCPTAKQTLSKINVFAIKTGIST